MSEANTASLFTPESGKRTQGELIPKGTLAWLGLTFQDMKQSKNTSGLYASFELTIIGEDGIPNLGRKLWTMICDPFDGRNSEAWRKMSVAAMTRIFEAYGVFNPADPETYNKFNGQTFQVICQNLDGAVGAAKIGIEAGEEGHADKNNVAEWLSPNPISGGNKEFLKLTNPQQAAEQARTGFLGSAGQVASPQVPALQPPAPAQQAPVAAPVAAAAAAPAGAPSFQKPAGGAPATSAARPAWLNAVPPAAK